MELTLGTNIQSLTAQNHLYMRTKNLNKDLEQAASGKRINTAADDAAGVSVSDGLMTQIRGRKKAIEGIENGINILKVAEGSLVTISEHMQRMRELTVEAANDVFTSSERRALVMEVAKRLDDITRIANSTQFHKVNLLDGSASQFRIQTGAESDVSTNTINIGDVLNDASASALGLGGLNVTAVAGGIYGSGTNARQFLDTIDAALGSLNDRRAQIAAYSNRLDSVLQSESNSIQGYTKSYSTIRDADIASLTADMAKQNILRQSSISLIAQANTQSEVVLQLLAA